MTVADEALLRLVKPDGVGTLTARAHHALVRKIPDLSYHGSPLSHHYTIYKVVGQYLIFYIKKASCQWGCPHWAPHLHETASEAMRESELPHRLFLPPIGDRSQRTGHLDTENELRFRGHVDLYPDAPHGKPCPIVPEGPRVMSA